MIINVDSTSSIPLYVQIAEQVKRAIASGILIKGEVLPSRRKLAAQLDINPLTVQNAYKALAEERLIEILGVLWLLLTWRLTSIAHT